MKEQRLTKLLVEGYPHFKENSGVPAWLLPERSFVVVVDNLGDAKVLDSFGCLGQLPDTAKETPDHESSSADMWRQACLDCAVCVKACPTGALAMKEKLKVKG